jgi:molybdopterin-guanine dinucleotide biosynthesis protein B
VTELRDAPEPDFADVIAALAPCDLIIVEGYKSHPIPKIEARRKAALEKRPLAATDATVIGIAADHAVEGEQVPVLALDDIAGIADLIARQLDLPAAGA